MPVGHSLKKNNKRSLQLLLVMGKELQYSWHKAIPCSFVPSIGFSSYLPNSSSASLNAAAFSHRIKVSHFIKFLLLPQPQNILDMKSTSALLQPTQPFN